MFGNVVNGVEHDPQWVFARQHFHSLLRFRLEFLFSKNKKKIRNPHIILLDRPRTDCAFAVGRDEISQLHDEVFAMTEKLILKSKVKKWDKIQERFVKNLINWLKVKPQPR